MLRIIAAGLLVAFATVAVTVPADAAKRQKYSQRSASYGSEITAGARRSTVYRSATTYRSASSYSPRARMVTIVGIRDRSVSPFRRGRANGSAFFDDIASRASF